MAWPLTGSALTKYNRLLSDLRQYGDFIFVGAPDDITWLQETIVAASDGVLRPNLDDVANRSHYWMLRAMAFFADASAVVEPAAPCPECPPVVPCPDPRVTTTPSGLENEFGILSLEDIPGLTDVVIHGTEVGYGADIEFQTSLVSFIAPDLVLLDDSHFIFGSNSALTGFSFPVLVTMDNFADIQWFSNSVLTSVSLPVLTTIDNSSFLSGSSPAMISFSLPALITVDNSGAITVSNSPALTSVSLGSATFGNGTVLDFSANALTDVSVNHVLARAVANLAYVSGSINLSGGTNAAPTGQGIVDKATLIGRGVTVTTN